MQVDADEDNFEHDGDGRWPFRGFVEQIILDMFDPSEFVYILLGVVLYYAVHNSQNIFAVWEVRHGSVMALREILTHHGGSAGVLMPDLSLDGAVDDLKDLDYSSTVKREREIDLNMQVSAEELEPHLKRPKLEEGTSLSTGTMSSTACGGNFDITVKVEDGGWNIPAGQVNGQVDVNAVKMEECDNYTDGISCSSKGAAVVMEPKGHCEDKGSIVKSDILNNLAENSDLTNFVKLARHSWMKNSEFLQDCAIRFLCILSLDR